MGPKAKAKATPKVRYLDIKGFKGHAAEVLVEAQLKKFFDMQKQVSPNQPHAKGSRFYMKDAAHGVDFTCKLRGARCCAKKRNGGACSMRVVQAMLCCFQHTSAVFKLRVDKSALGGFNGLFVCDKSAAPGAVVFKKGEEVCPYYGEVLTQAQLDARYPGNTTAPYTFHSGGAGTQSKYLDSACFQTLGGKANVASGKKRNNAWFTRTGSASAARIRAKRNLRNGEEVFVSYGNTYKLADTSGFRPRTAAKKKKQACGRKP